MDITSAESMVISMGNNFLYSTKLSPSTKLKVVVIYGSVKSFVEARYPVSRIRSDNTTYAPFPRVLHTRAISVQFVTSINWGNPPNVDAIIVS